MVSIFKGLGMSLSLGDLKESSSAACYRYLSYVNWLDERAL